MPKYARHALTSGEQGPDESNEPLYKVEPLFSKELLRMASPEKATQNSITRKSLQILRLMWENGDRKVVYTFSLGQRDLANRLHVTRQALSIHFKRLRELGLIQVGRGFINVTEEGLKTVGYRSNPVIVHIRVSPQKRLEVFGKIRALPAIEMFRVTGDVDAVLVVEHDKLDQILGKLASTDGILETRSLVSIDRLQ